MTIWFTSDQHFGHKNIIKSCNRPFGSVEEMDAALIANWQVLVKPEDEIWCLGDFAFRNSRSVSSYLSELPGKKHLIHGNHDSEETKNLSAWASSQGIAEIKIGKQVIVLCHYALRVWHWKNGGTLHFYGHSHGQLPGCKQSLDVGVDCFDFKPVTLERINERLMLSIGDR
jgi:calcineurin-like phosphoesterase family protein